MFIKTKNITKYNSHNFIFEYLISHLILVYLYPLSVRYMEFLENSDFFTEFIQYTENFSNFVYAKLAEFIEVICVLCIV